MKQNPQKRIALLKPGELNNPTLAIPTILVFLFAITGWSLTAFLGFKNHISVYVSIPIQSIFMFIMFTPLHDAAHSSIGKSPYKFVNEFIGRVYTTIMLAPFPAFRWAHLQHHKHTNTVHDPDMWSSGFGYPKFLLPLFWMTQDYHYYVPYLRNAIVLKTRPKWEVVECIGVVVFMHYIAFKALVMNPFATLCFWMIPNRVGLLLLAYLFDYLPHHPHTTPASVNPYKATAHIDGLFRSKDMNLDLVLLYQNYHNVHHLYPTIPFYQMGLVWATYEKQLRELGTPISQVF
jgi:fatty acid desaturase